MFDEQSLSKITKEREKWEKTTVPSWLRRNPERKGEFKTTSGINIKRLYTPEDVKNLDYLRDLGFPGQFPFTRSLHATMYRGRLWTMRQFSGFGTAEQTNKRFRYLLKEGETGLSVAFDYPTIMGRDSDDPMCNGEVGICGVAVSSLKDMEILFDGIPLDKVTTSMTINGPASMLLAMYIAIGDKQGVPRGKLGGTTQNDMLKEFYAQKLCIFPPKPSVKLVVDIIEYCAKHLPKWNPVSISGYHIREAGSNAVQELAFTLADGITYVESTLERGLKVDDFAPRLSFFFAAHNNFFEEIAKFRAARRLWAKIMKERFKAKDPRSLWMRMHVQTSGCTLTAQQPVNNVVRVALQSLAAVLGGTQSLHTNSLDETLALPSEEAVTVALRTQQIIAHESGVVDTVDPLSGSYCVEALTNEMEERAMDYINKIDDMGGVIAAIENGFLQKEIADSAYKYQQEIDNKERILVGVNDYTVEEDWVPLKILRIAPDVEAEQLARLQKVKRERNNARVKKVLDKLHGAADRDENLMPTIIEAVKSYATLGEITNVFRSVFGEYQELIVI
ncbi:MAG: methylmalonyl-CoA mutase family protein [Candidatus Bathyarchaeota archaeon]|nr:methylmalonyl-CoA mutase family protein [Candidatus Bathyarchaeota archaeon]MDH5623613.1 methylmalonyl-CoA mutase family protein [Candidatus Bathyarchaeota archaeon]MDH5635535.1 methylmalonyl-CoA mutase family protein [Candidatus Bathyarchaeota archaeon]